MEQEARDLIRRLLEEGKRHDEVRQSIISHGYSTEAFEEVYTAIQTELGLEEPAPTSWADHTATRTAMEDPMPEDRPHSSTNSNIVKNIVKLLLGVFVISIAVILLSEYGGSLRTQIFGDDENVDRLTVDDAVREKTLQSYALSAKRYERKLLDYQGLCASIGVNTEVYACRENTESFVMHTTLSDGRYYCVDSTGFEGAVEPIARSVYVCQ